MTAEIQQLKNIKHVRAILAKDERVRSDEKAYARVKILANDYEQYYVNRLNKSNRSGEYS